MANSALTLGFRVSCLMHVPGFSKARDWRERLQGEKVRCLSSQREEEEGGGRVGLNKGLNNSEEYCPRWGSTHLGGGREGA